MEYIIIERDNAGDLSEKINRLMGDGWKPQGGVSAYSSTGHRDYYCQAVVRKHTIRKQSKKCPLTIGLRFDIMET